jgi:hypothetical protein
MMNQSRVAQLTQRTAPRLFVASSLVALALVLSSCVEWIGAQGTLVVADVKSFPASIQEDCIIGTDSIRSTGGVWDVSFFQGYTMALTVMTNLPATTSTAEVQSDNQRSPNFPYYGNADANIVVLDGVEVFVEDSAGGDLDPLPSGEVTFQDTGNPIDLVPDNGNPDYRTASGIVFNTQTSLGAQDVVFVEALRAEVAESIFDGGDQFAPLTARIEDEGILSTFVNVRVFGYTSGGGQVRSNIFTYPVDMCIGCLQPVAPVCEAPNRIVLGNPCTPPGQDAPTLCCPRDPGC